MKSYKITVNGQSYDVTVEELGSSSPRSAPQAPASAATSPVSAGTANIRAAATPSAPSAARAGAVAVKAPMPGTLLGYKVAQGQTVKKGQVILILEAMKMENEIVAPVDGYIASLRASEGASVNTGDVLVEIA